MGFKPMNFIFNLKYMLSGMVIIILVMLIIIVITMVLNKIPSNEKE